MAEAYEAGRVDNPLDPLLDADVFGKAYEVLRAAHSVAPFDVPCEACQLARIVGGIFTMAPEGEFAAPTAGRLMHEVSVGLIMMAIDPNVTDEDHPLQWEPFLERDRAPVYTSAMLMAVRPYMGREEWNLLGGKLYTHWAKTKAFPEDGMRQLKRKYLEVLNGRSTDDY